MSSSLYLLLFMLLEVFSCVLVRMRCLHSCPVQLLCLHSISLEDSVITDKNGACTEKLRWAGLCGRPKLGWKINLGR